MSLGRGPRVVSALLPALLVVLLAPGTPGARPARAAPRPAAVASDSGGVADALAAEVETLVVTGRYWEPATLAKLERALRLRERDPGRDSLPLGATLETQGRLLQARWDDPGAIASFERALEIRRRALGDADPATLGAMRRLGLAWLELRGGRPSDADSLIAHSSALTARRFSTDAPERIDADEASALLAEARGQASWPLFSSVLERSERVLGPDDLELAERLVMISERLRGSPRAQEAGELMRRAHAIYARRLGDENLLTATSWNLIGVNHVWSAQFAAALPYFEQSLVTIRALVGDDHVELVKPLLDLGDVDCRLGNPATGIPYLERALAIAERRLPPDDGLTALALRMLGEQYLDAGRISEARALLERRLAWDLRMRRPGHPDIAWTEDLLAGAIDDPKRQRQLYEDVSRIYLAFYGPEHPRGARARMLTAQFRFADGDTLGAIALCDSVTATFDRVRGPESVEAAWARWTLGSLDLVAGRTGAAVKEIERAVSGFTASVGSDHVFTAIGLRGLAVALLVANRPRDAFAAAERAEAIHRGLLEDNARAMAESRALQLPASPYLSIASGTDVMLSLALGPLAGDATVRRAAWDAVIRSRAVVQETVLERHQGWFDGSDPALAPLAARFDSTSRRLAQLVVRGPAPDRPQDFTGELARARTQRDAVEADLAAHSARLRAVEARERVGLEATCAALPRDAALVAYVRFGRLTPAAAGVPTAKPSLAAFVVDGRDSVTLVPLGPQSRVDSLVDGWGREVRQAAEGGTANAEAERRYRRVAGRLRAVVWDPVTRFVRDARRVFLVPDGTLGLVNFATLPVGSGSYLLESGPSQHVLPTERALAMGSELGRRGRGLLAMGAPAFDSTFAPAGSDEGPLTTASYRGSANDCVAFRDVRFAALPASAGEVRAIASLWASAAGERAPDVEVALGARASETEFRARAPGRCVLHLATHGFVTGTACIAEATAMRGIGGMVPATATSAATVADDAPRLSGLALAGANLRARARPGLDDGILTADEIASLDLEGVQWAVLSACDTGLGDYQATEGLMGFRRAFLVAGVRTTIMSLWPVRDANVERWMRTLYDAHWSRGLDTADAVRAASLAELKRLRAAGKPTHPAEWGAFIAVGDWR